MMSYMTLTELAELVAQRTKLDKDDVWEVCEGLIDAMMEMLHHGEEIKIRGLGKLYWKMAARRNIRMINTGEVVAYPPRLKLKFLPSKELRKARIMQKYGVETDTDMTKEASKHAGTTCPVCQLALDDGGACPTHGTKPFERAKGHDDKKEDLD